MAPRTAPTLPSFPRTRESTLGCQQFYYDPLVHSPENGNPPHIVSLYKSDHVGLLSSINSIFHAPFHFLSAFSLPMALSMDR